MMKLIVEELDRDSIQYLVESKEEEKEPIYRIKGPFMVSEQKNKNGRVYPKSIIEREVGKYQDKIKNRRSLGELDHSPNPNVNLDRASHIIESLEMDGNVAMGVAKIIDTPMGRIAKTFMNEGIKLGVSSRGLGSLEKDGQTVSKNFVFITEDIVNDPSGPGCFVEGILESKEYIIKDDRYVEVAVENLQNSVEKAVLKKDKSAHYLRLMKEFLDELRGNFS